MASTSSPYTNTIVPAPPKTPPKRLSNNTYPLLYRCQHPLLYTFSPNPPNHVLHETSEQATRPGQRSLLKMRARII